jgi:hypothetical protein
MLQRSLLKERSFIAKDALLKIAEKRRKEANKVLRKATIAFTRAINKQARDLKAEGVFNRVVKGHKKKIFNNTRSLNL